MALKMTADQIHAEVLPTVTLEDEIVQALTALGDGEFGGFAISRWIEEHTPSRPWRLLWWSGTRNRIIGYGTLYRALDRLQDQGIVVQHVYYDRDPPRVTFRLA